MVPIGEDQVDRNGVLANSTGFPAIAFPGGFSAPTRSAPARVPVGVELLGPDWSEPILIKPSMDVEFSVELVKKKAIAWPRLENNDYIMVLASERPLLEALQHATTEMQKLLVADLRIQRARRRRVHGSGRRVRDRQRGRP